MKTGEEKEDEIKEEDEDLKKSIFLDVYQKSISRPKTPNQPSPRTNPDQKKKSKQVEPESEKEAPVLSKSIVNVAPEQNKTKKELIDSEETKRSLPIENREKLEDLRQPYMNASEADPEDSLTSSRLMKKSTYTDPGSRKSSRKKKSQRLTTKQKMMQRRNEVRQYRKDKGVGNYETQYKWNRFKKPASSLRNDKVGASGSKSKNRRRFKVGGKDRTSEAANSIQSYKRGLDREKKAQQSYLLMSTGRNGRKSHIASARAAQKGATEVDKSSSKKYLGSTSRKRRKPNPSTNNGNNLESEGKEKPMSKSGIHKKKWNLYSKPDQLSRSTYRPSQDDPKKRQRREPRRLDRSQVSKTQKGGGAQSGRKSAVQPANKSPFRQARNNSSTKKIKDQKRADKQRNTKEKGIDEAVSSKANQKAVRRRLEGDKPANSNSRYSVIQSDEASPVKGSPDSKSKVLALKASEIPWDGQEDQEQKIEEEDDNTLRGSNQPNFAETRERGRQEYLISKDTFRKQSSKKGSLLNTMETKKGRDRASGYKRPFFQGRRGSTGIMLNPRDVDDDDDDQAISEFYDSKQFQRKGAEKVRSPQNTRWPSEKDQTENGQNEGNQTLEQIFVSPEDKKLFVKKDEAVDQATEQELDGEAEPGFIRNRKSTQRTNSRSRVLKPLIKSPEDDKRSRAPKLSLSSKRLVFKNRKRPETSQNPKDEGTAAATSSRLKRVGHQHQLIPLESPEKEDKSKKRLNHDKQPESLQGTTEASFAERLPERYQGSERGVNWPSVSPNNTNGHRNSRGSYQKKFKNNRFEMNSDHSKDINASNSRLRGGDAGQNSISSRQNGNRSFRKKFQSGAKKAHQKKEIYFKSAKGRKNISGKQKTDQKDPQTRHKDRMKRSAYNQNRRQERHSSESPASSTVEKEVDKTIVKLKNSQNHPSQKTFKRRLKARLKNLASSSSSSSTDSLQQNSTQKFKMISEIQRGYGGEEEHEEHLSEFYVSNGSTTRQYKSKTPTGAEMKTIDLLAQEEGVHAQIKVRLSNSETNLDVYDANVQKNQQNEARLDAFQNRAVVMRKKDYRIEGTDLNLPKKVVGGNRDGFGDQTKNQFLRIAGRYDAPSDSVTAILHQDPDQDKGSEGPGEETEETPEKKSKIDEKLKLSKFEDTGAKEDRNEYKTAKTVRRQAQAQQTAAKISEERSQSRRRKIDEIRLLKQKRREFRRKKERREVEIERDLERREKKLKIRRIQRTVAKERNALMKNLNDRFIEELKKMKNR